MPGDALLSASCGPGWVWAVLFLTPICYRIPPVLAGSSEAGKYFVLRSLRPSVWMEMGRSRTHCTESQELSALDTVRLVLSTSHIRGMDHCVRTTNGALTSHHVAMAATLRHSAHVLLLWKRSTLKTPILKYPFILLAKEMLSAF